MENAPAQPLKPIEDRVTDEKLLELRAIRAAAIDSVLNGANWLDAAHRRDASDQVLNGASLVIKRAQTVIDTEKKIRQLLQT